MEIPITAVLFALGAALSVACCLAFLALQRRGRNDALDQLGVKQTYPSNCLPSAKIEAYGELKERMRKQFGKDGASEDTWMSALPAQAKDMLKYRLMQRAIGDMAALQRVDADARGYWRLFSKGVVTKTFWDSVVKVERELSMELEKVKAEAACIEPAQDPQGIISEAMQFILRFGDRLPSPSDVPAGTDAVDEMMKHLPQMGQPGPGPPPGHPAAMRPQAPPPGGGSCDAYSWKQDNVEVEVSVGVPNNATKAGVKVAFQPRSLKVEHSGSVLVEGQLCGMVRPEDCTWTLEKGRIVVTLEKTDPRPWPSLLAAKA